jgi:ATP-dependent Clp protease ATP-binding subunit ClpA
MADEPHKSLDSPMFERFTERARQVVVLAQEEARTLKHNYIGTEHILLGLVREDEGVAARILLDFDADAERVRTGSAYDGHETARAARTRRQTQPEWRHDPGVSRGVHWPL